MHNHDTKTFDKHTHRQKYDSHPYRNALFPFLLADNLELRDDVELVAQMVSNNLLGNVPKTFYHYYCLIRTQMF